MPAMEAEAPASVDLAWPWLCRWLLLVREGGQACLKQEHRERGPGTTGLCGAVRVTHPPQHCARGQVSGNESADTCRC